MKRMSDSDVEQAVKQAANYYRTSRLYTSLYNTDDAYSSYIDDLTDDTRLIVQQGHSYKLKNEFIIALNLKQFEAEHEKSYHHYFDCINNYMMPYIDRELDEVIFICAACPSHQFFTSDTYRLFNEFAVEYSSKYIILTDCPVEIDFGNFAGRTGSRKVLIAGMEYFRWGCRRES